MAPEYLPIYGEDSLQGLYIHVFENNMLEISA